MSNQLNKVFEKNKNFPWQTINGETIIIDPENQFSYELNEMGSFIWNQIDGQTSIELINQRIVDEFDASSEEVMFDLEQLVGELVEKKIIGEQGL